MKNNASRNLGKLGLQAIIWLSLGLTSVLAQVEMANQTTMENKPMVNHILNVNWTSTAAPVAMLNSPYEDLKPALAPCGKKLFFSRANHPFNTNSENDREDIWYAEMNEDMEWTEPKRMGGILNNDGPNYIHNVSASGDTIILGNQYLKNGKMKAGLSYSVHLNGQWTTPEPIRIKNFYSMSDQSHAHVSLKTGIIISAIQTIESMGGNDLYVSFWNGKEASEPINMGDVINSDMDESSPYLASDNATLYFASRGHNGYGGFDIWVTHRLDDTWTNWSKPENLGPAVNSSLDDEFFSISHCGKFAMFSKRVNVHNTDIFRISTLELFGEARIPQLQSISMVASRN